MSDNRLMTCEQLEERLADWLEQDVDAGTRAALERHVSGCARCRALVADLAAVRRQAVSLPELVPSRDLWPDIEARIQAPVISLAPKHAARSTQRTWWMGAAAAGLVAVTAGVTYVLTTNGGSTPPIVATGPAVVDRPDTLEPAVVNPAATLASDTQRSSAQRAGALRAGRQSGPPATPPAPAEEASEYARDVAQLRAIVAQRRAELDSATVAVLEKNLELIDRAIAESRAALQRDPASEFLADQLARAMTKKVAILRTVALLPVRS
jgi:Putative zinc-finger